MSLRLTIGTICTLLLALAACERKAGSHLPPIGDDFAENADGHGTARLLGIDFEVEETGSGASVKSTFVGNPSDPDQSHGRKDAIFGADAKIRLEKVPGGPINLHLNGLSFGPLEVGDKVVIDRERNVTVNGAPLLPAGASQQQENENPEADPESSDAPTSPDPGESS